MSGRSVLEDPLGRSSQNRRPSMTDWKSRPTKEAVHQEPLVLIIDDDSEMRELLETLFELIGLATFQAGNNSEALAQALTDHPDLITTDMFRPGGSGLDFIEQIRAITALQDTPIVMISGGATLKIWWELSTRK